MKLRTAPLMFRVWDKERQLFVPPESFTIDGTGSLSVNVIRTLPDGSYEYRTYDDDFDRFIVSQDTGCVDDDGQSLFTGDIVEGKLDEGVRKVIAYNGYANMACWSNWLEESMFASSTKFHKIGNIWENRNLLNG